jgi:hypothetical protein
MLLQAEMHLYCGKSVSVIDRGRPPHLLQTISFSLDYWWKGTCNKYLVLRWQYAHNQVEPVKCLGTPSITCWEHGHPPVHVGTLKSTPVLFLSTTCILTVLEPLSSVY